MKDLLGKGGMGIKMAAVAILLPLLIPFLILFILYIILMTLLSNYQHCTLPFEYECWNPNAIYQEDPITDKEINEFVYGRTALTGDKKSIVDEGMIGAREKLLSSGILDKAAQKFITDIPILDENSVVEYDDKNGFGKKNSDGSQPVTKPADEDESVSDSETEQMGEGTYKITDMTIITPEMKERLRGMVFRVPSDSNKTNVFLKNGNEQALEWFLSAAETNKVDPAFLISIMINETGWGTSFKANSLNNIGGIRCPSEANKQKYNVVGCTDDNFSKFASVKDSIDFQAAIIRGYVDNRGADTVAEVGNIYAPPSDGQINSNWIPTVAKLLTGLGKNVGNYGIPGVISIPSTKRPDFERYEFKQEMFERIDKNTGKGISQVDFDETKKLFISKLKAELHDAKGSTKKMIEDFIDDYKNDSVAKIIEGLKKVSYKEGWISKEEIESYAKMTSGSDVINSLKNKASSEAGNYSNSLSDSIERFESMSEQEMLDYWKYTGYVDYHILPGYISEAELHLRTIMQLDMEGTIGMDMVEYEQAHALLKMKRLISNYRNSANLAKTDNLKLKNEALYTSKEQMDSEILKMKNEFKEFAVGKKYYEGKIDSLTDEKIMELLDRKVNDVNKILSESAAAGLMYPLIADSVGYVPNAFNDKLEKDINKKYDELISTGKISEKILSSLAIGHRMKEIAKQVYREQYRSWWHFGATGTADELEKYLKGEREKAIKLNAGEKIYDESEAESIKQGVVQVAKNAWSDVKGYFNVKKQFKKLVTYNYMDMSVKENSFVRYAIYNQTNELVEIGAFARNYCVYHYDYGINKEVDDDDVRKDFCIQINDSAVDSAMLTWEQSDMLDKLKVREEISFSCDIVRIVKKEKKKASTGNTTTSTSSNSNTTSGAVQGWFNWWKADPNKKPLQPISVSYNMGEINLPEALTKVPNFSSFKLNESIYESLSGDLRGRISGLGTYGLKDEDGILVGEATFGETSITLHWIDIKNNTDRNLYLLDPPPCSDEETEDEIIYKDLSLIYNKTAEAYYPEVKDAFLVSAEFSLYFAQHELELKKLNDELSKTTDSKRKAEIQTRINEINTAMDKEYEDEAFDIFMLDTNVDYVKDPKFVQEFRDWLLNRSLDDTISSGGGVISGNPGDDSEIIPPTGMFEEAGFGLPLPLKPGEKVRVTSGKGMRFHPVKKTPDTMHWGVDMSRPQGDIISIGDGVVIATGSGGSFGINVTVEHTTPQGKVISAYGHMSSKAVSKGDVVKQGQKLGVMGSTGSSTATHLHFNLYVNAMDRAHMVNALYYLPFNSANAYCSESAENCKILN